MIHLHSCTRPANNLTPVFDRLLGQFFTDPGTPSRVAPLEARVRPQEDALVLQFDLPGYRREEVKLHIEDHRLTLEAAVPHDDPRAFRGDRRGSWRLSPDLDPTRIEARLDHGVLEVVIPKRATAVARTIEIN